MTEKLVEETVQSIFFALDYITEAGDDGIERYRLATWWAKHIITRIPKAVRDGELDEILGVVERVDARDTPGGKLWIALRKEETGEER